MRLIPEWSSLNLTAMETVSTWRPNLSPKGYSLIVLLLALAGGILYFFKPEVFDGLIPGTVILDEERVLNGLRPELDTYLHSAALKAMIAQNATQAEINQLKEISIHSLRAEPRDFYSRERDFWYDTELRWVDLTVTFSAGDDTYSAQGEFTVDARANRFVLYHTELQ